MGVFYNKKDHLFASTRGECSTNIPQTISNDNPKKIPYKSSQIFTYLQNSFKNHTIEISIVNFFINKTINNQKATKNKPL